MPGQCPTAITAHLMEQTLSDNPADIASMGLPYSAIGHHGNEPMGVRGRTWHPQFGQHLCAAGTLELRTDCLPATRWQSIALRFGLMGVTAGRGRVLSRSHTQRCLSAPLGTLTWSVPRGESLHLCRRPVRTQAPSQGDVLGLDPRPLTEEPGEAGPAEAPSSSPSSLTPFITAPEVTRHSALRKTPSWVPS